jgi:hypothetical protein
VVCQAHIAAVPCRDFALRNCPYGEYCSFIHDPQNLYDEEKHAKKSDAAEAKVESKVVAQMAPKIEAKKPTVSVLAGAKVKDAVVPEVPNIKEVETAGIDVQIDTPADHQPRTMLKKSQSTDILSAKYESSPATLLAPRASPGPERPRSTPAHIVTSPPAAEDTNVPSEPKQAEEAEGSVPASAPEIPSSAPSSSPSPPIPAPQPLAAHPMRLSLSLSPPASQTPSLDGPGPVPQLHHRGSGSFNLPSPPSKAYPWSPPSSANAPMWTGEWPDMSHATGPAGEAPASPTKAGFGKKGRNVKIVPRVQTAPPKGVKNGPKSPVKGTPSKPKPEASMMTNASKGPVIDESAAVTEAAADNSNSPPKGPLAEVDSVPLPRRLSTGSDNAPPGCIHKSDTVWTPSGTIIRNRPQYSYHTKLCKYFAAGSCPYGDKCGL